MALWKDAQDNIYDDDNGVARLLTNWPDGLVEITQQEADALRAPTAAAAKLCAWEKIKAKRDQLRFDGGVKVGTHWFLSTAVATAEYNTLLLLSAGIPDTTVLRANWRTMDGAVVDMTPVLVKQILTAGFAQVAAIDDAAQTHRASMEAAADPAAYDFSAGWPAVCPPQP